MGFWSMPILPYWLLLIWLWLGPWKHHGYIWMFLVGIHGSMDLWVQMNPVIQYKCIYIYTHYVCTLHWHDIYIYTYICHMLCIYFFFKNIEDISLYPDSSPRTTRLESRPIHPGLLDGILRALLPTSVADGNHFFLAGQSRRWDEWCDTCHGYAEKCSDSSII